jgi:hypothetical protein
MARKNVTVYILLVVHWQSLLRTKSFALLLLKESGSSSISRAHRCCHFCGHIDLSCCSCMSKASEHQIIRSSGDGICYKFLSSLSAFLSSAQDYVECTAYKLNYPSVVRVHMCFCVVVSVHIHPKQLKTRTSLKSSRYTGCMSVDSGWTRWFLWALSSWYLYYLCLSIWAAPLGCQRKWKASAHVSRSTLSSAQMFKTGFAIVIWSPNKRHRISG